MEAASVHRIGDVRKPRYVNKHGEVAEWMPADAGPEAMNMIDGLLGEVATLKSKLTKEQRRNEREDIAQAQHQVILNVLDYWRDTCAAHPDRVRFPPASRRYKKTKERLEEGWGPEDLKRVVDYAQTDPWLNGTEAGSPGYLDPETLFRDTEQVEKRLGQWFDMQDRLLDEKMAAFFEQHPSMVNDAIVREGQVESLQVLAPCAFEPRPSEVREVGFEEYPEA